MKKTATFISLLFISSAICGCGPDRLAKSDSPAGAVDVPNPPLTEVLPVDPGPQTGPISCSGFDVTYSVNWDWSATPLNQIDTVDLGGIGMNGILVVGFTASAPADVDNLSFVDAIGYPAPNQLNQMTLSISTLPCDLSAADPGISVSYAPTVTFGIGKVPVRWWDGKPTALALTPGQRYYINIAGRSAGQNTCVPNAFGSCDFRLALRKPAGH